MSNSSTVKTKPQKKPPSRTARPWWQSPIVWVAALIFVALAVTIALSAGGDDSTDGGVTPLEVADASAFGDPLPVFRSPDPAIGLAAPTINATTLAGDNVTIGADGTARLIGFFAHWCPHCQAELPRTTEWLENNELPANVEVIAVSTAVSPTDDNYPPSEWFADEGFPAPVLIDSAERSIAAGFGLSAFPFWVAVDSSGNVLTRQTGQLTDSQFETLIDALAATTSDENAAGTTNTPGVRLVNAQDAAALHTDPPADLVVLDVRTPEEFAEGHLDRAVLIDFYGPSFADEIAGLDPTVPYLIYCRSGNRSGQTTELMRQLNFTDVTEIDGGILSWQDAALPLAVDAAA